jgi:hypothetical protein
MEKYLIAAQEALSGSMKAVQLNLDLKPAPIGVSTMLDTDGVINHKFLKAASRQLGLHHKNWKKAAMNHELDTFYGHASQQTVRGILTAFIATKNITTTAKSLDLHPALIWLVLKMAYSAWKWNHSDYFC